MTMAYMQRAGHKPIVLLGGGTAAIGDPSAKTDMRPILTREMLDYNASRFQKQMERLLMFDGENAAIIRNNADWLRNLNFLDFMREIGVHFSVNRMLAAECYKQRMDRGLTFFELSYMLMQSYDFLVLNREYGCTLQMGGDDQWSNILAGADLIRRKERKSAFALTTALLETSDGVKMGKTVKGALWLDKAKTSPYEFYQYWRNVGDADVKKCLLMLTFLPVEEISSLTAQEGSALNEAKRVLAFTLTEQVHGTQEAEAAQEAAQALFGGAGSLDNMPTVELTQNDIEESGMRVVDLLVVGRLCKSKSDARRMIESGAVLLDDVKVTEVSIVADADKLADGIILRKGKKAFVRLIRN